MSNRRLGRAVPSDARATLTHRQARAGLLRPTATLVQDAELDAPVLATACRVRIAPVRASNGCTP
jgi:hypothetical protein